MALNLFRQKGNMENPLEALKSNSGQPGEGLKTILSLLKGLPASPGTPLAAPSEQLGPELAYKLAQAVSRASDPDLLIVCVAELMKALQGIDSALSGGPAAQKAGE